MLSLVGDLPILAFSERFHRPNAKKCPDSLDEGEW